MGTYAIIPSRESDVLERARTFVTVAKAHKKDWQIQDASLLKLEKALKETEPLAALCKTEDKRTPLRVAQKNASLAVLKKALSDFYHFVLRARKDSIGLEGWAELGMSNPERKKRSSEQSPPKSVAVLQAIPQGRHAVVAQVVNVGRGAGKEKPHFTVFRWGVCETQPESHRDLPELHLEKTAAFRTEFTAAHEGSKVYFSASFVDSKGRQGAWSKPIYAIIS